MEVTKMVEMPDKDTNQTEENPKKLWKKKTDKLAEELEKAKADVEHWKNEYYRAYADTKNLRISLEKDHLTAMKYRAEGFIEDLLPVLDSFHLALANEPTDPTLKNYLVGFQYIYRNLVNVLENEGVTEIAPKNGDKFDAAVMNASEAIECEGEENLVIKVYTKGYKLHDRLVRPANVAVSKKKTENQEKTDA